MTRLAALRILVSSYAAIWTAARLPHLVDVTEFSAARFEPVGPLAWLDGPVPSGVLVGVAVLTPPLGVAAAVGWRYRVTGPLLAAGFLFVTTYRNSWGQIFHTENLVAIHLVLLAVAPAHHLWSVDGRHGRRKRPAEGDWAVKAMAVATVTTYLVAGMAKIRNGGLAWFDGDVLVHQVAFDNVRKRVLGDVWSPLAELLVANRWLATPAALGSILVELGAPAALLNDWIGRRWCFVAWTFHVAVLLFMAILFPYHLLGLALAPLLPVERPVSWLVGRFGPAGDRATRDHAVLD